LVVVFFHAGASEGAGVVCGGVGASVVLEKSLDKVNNFFVTLLKLLSPFKKGNIFFKILSSPQVALLQ
jgi:hypothetical protein